MAGRSYATIRISTDLSCSRRDMSLLKSGHSRGSTVDLTLFHLDDR